MSESDIRVTACVADGIAMGGGGTKAADIRYPQRSSRISLTLIRATPLEAT